MTNLWPYSPSLRYHGGSCCGVKHIASFEGFNPTTQLVAVNREKARKEYKNTGGIYHLFPGSYSESYEIDLPEEAGALRLYRILDMAVKTCYAHRLEITLINRQLLHWRDVLEECGFKLTSEHKNGNTGNKIYTFNLVYNNRSDDKSLHTPEKGFYNTYGKKYQPKEKAAPKASAKKAAPAPFQAAAPVYVYDYESNTIVAG